MATIIVCDGGCGAQSPDPKTKLFVANNWLTVRAGYRRAFEELGKHGDRQFCDKCAPRVIAAIGEVRR